MSSATRKKPRAESNGVCHPAAATLTDESAEPIKLVPPARSLRNQLRRRAAQAASNLDPSQPLEKSDLEGLARDILAEQELSAGFLGWTMVMLASAFWRQQVIAVPHNRRLLLLPGDLSHSADCRRATAVAESTGKRRAASSAPSPLKGEGRGEGDAPPLDSAVPTNGHPRTTTNGHSTTCPACTLRALQSHAETLGYQIHAVEESQSVLNALLVGEIDAIIGMASLDLLEKAIDHILWFGLPCMALPLLDSAAADNGSLGEQFDADWLREMIELPHAAADRAAPNYVHLMRTAKRMFEPDQLEELAPRTHHGPTLAEMNGNAAALIDPISGTEAIAHDFLARGGKHSRPFITLAVYDAMTGGHGARPGGHRHLGQLPAAIKRAALSIETFHKASLVHDDIEDDDPFRYGEPTLHRRFGIPVAINVGDYLIGLGYRLVSRESKTLGAEIVCDILDRLAEAHMRLSEGQGAELLWRDSRDKRLSPQEALRIYALKTAPAFEAALLTGLRLAGPTTDYLEPIGEFARSLGTAFQILNDLGDWNPDRHNKLIAAGDVIGGRPTVLWALALEGLSGKSRRQLETLAATLPTTEDTVGEIANLYREAGVFDKAGDFVRQYELAAREVAKQLDPPELRRLLEYLIEMVLRRPKLPTASA